MDRIRELVRLHRLGKSTREVARLLNMSPNTERKFRLKLEEVGLLEGDPMELPSMERLRVVIPQRARPKHELSSIESWYGEVVSLMNKGKTPTDIHEMLGNDEGFSGSLSAVKRLYRRIKKDRGPKATDIAIPVVTDAGKIAQVDFGECGMLYDPATQKMRKAYVFVMTLGCSRHMYAEVVFDQKIGTWLRIHINAFLFFGGVPEIIVPDNLKSAVIKAIFKVDELSVLNRAYRELARHYGFVIDPTPAYSPEKKGKVESSVKYVKNAFFGRRELRHPDEANSQLRAWIVEKAGMRTHGTTRRRPMELFEEVEKGALIPLPKSSFVEVEWKIAKVGINGHVTFDREAWSVPWTNSKKNALIRATSRTVEVYVKDDLVATHARQPRDRWHTVESHLPEHRRDFRHRSRKYWEDRADKLGNDVGAFIRTVFDEDEVLYPINRVVSIMLALEGVSQERAAAASRRAAYFGNTSPKDVKRILTKKLDALPLPSDYIPQSWSKDPRFARMADSFLTNLVEGGSHGSC